MSDELFAELSAFVDQRMAHHQAPGVALGLRAADQAYSAGFGVTNVDHPLAVDAHTLFQIGSITKTVTGTAVMRLVEMGILQLDTPIRHYLPGFRMLDQDATERVTLRHLLTHTGGWAGDYFSDTGMGDDALVRYVAEMATLPQLTPVGSLWTYNNAGFSLAGRVIEVVTGQTFEEAAVELVLRPLNMQESFFFPRDVMTYRFATGHFAGEEDRTPGIARPWALARSAHSAGGIIASISDLLRYARFHMGGGRSEDGARLLAPASLEEMQRPHIEANLGRQFGLSWFINEINGVRLIQHGGGTRGQQCVLMIARDKQFAICVLTNSDQGSYLCDDVTKKALALFLGVEAPSPQRQERNAAELAPYAGEYDAQLALITLALEGEDLVMHYQPKGGFPDKDSPPSPAPPPTRVAFTAGDEIVALDPPHTGSRAEFIRDDDGRIRWLRTSRLHRRL